jgi:hypothetical protein
MKKLIVIGASAFAATAASLAVISQAGAAPDQTGETFANAKAALTQAGYSVVVSSSAGDQLSRDDCIVVRQETTAASGFAGGGWPGAGKGNRVLLSLDCHKQPNQGTVNGGGQPAGGSNPQAPAPTGGGCRNAYGGFQNCHAH